MMLGTLLFSACLAAFLLCRPSASILIPSECTNDPLKLIPNDGTAGTSFGSSVAVYGSTAVVGAIGDDVNGEESGSVYVFQKSSSNGAAWEHQAKLLPDDGAAGDSFGISVSVYENTVVVGAPLGSDSGAVYVFTLIGAVWEQQAKLLPENGEEMDFFGWSVAIHEDTVVVGADEDNDNGENSGAAYVFTRANAIWKQQAKIFPDDGEEHGHFGYSVALHEDTAVIGSRYSIFDADSTSIKSSKVYVFVRNAEAWEQQAMLLPDDEAAHDRFGWSVAVYEGTALVGAPLRSDSGAAYLFTRNDGSWQQQTKLLPVGGAAKDAFGISLALYGGTIIIGASRDDEGGTDSGASYIFTHNMDTGEWEQQEKLLPVDSCSWCIVGDNFGNSVALHEETAFIGADESDSGSGAVYSVNLC